MATFRNRGNNWQARVQIKGHAPLSKTFINKIDAERSEKSTMFRYLTDIGNHCNMFYRQLKNTRLTSFWLFRIRPDRPRAASDCGAHYEFK